jgi:hypothetical protein
VGLLRFRLRIRPDLTWCNLANCGPRGAGLRLCRLAQLVEQIHLRGLPVDSLQLVRNGVLILDAYFYPYPDDRAHDVASVTESADLEFADPGEYFPAQTFQATSVVSCN